MSLISPASRSRIVEIETDALLSGERLAGELEQNPLCT